MRHSLGLLLAIGAAAITAVACGSSDNSEFGSSSGSSGDGSSGSSGFSSGSSGASGSSSGASTAEDVDPASLRIEPADKVIDLAAGDVATQGYKVFGKRKGSPDEVDMTARAVFYVPDNYLVGGFPLDGSPTFTSRLPASPNDPPQRGGKATVRATLSNSDGPVDVTTSLTIKLSATLNAPTPNPAIPADAAQRFANAPATPGRAPVLAYPNDGTMLPPNLRRLDVQWQPGSASNTLYEIAFSSATSTIVYYARCNTDTLVGGACGFELDEKGYGYLAESNRGQGPVKLRIRGTDDTGTGVGASAEFNIEFAESRVDGGLYYWNVSSTSIMRFDFGAATGKPETFASGACIGCHAISRDGTKMVASLNGQNSGYLVYSNAVDQVKNGVPSSFTVWNDQTNRVQFASFNPDGSQFVAIYGDDANKNNLYFHDGTTGVRAQTLTLSMRPDHPDWSPDGQKIAFTRVDTTNTTSQMPAKTSVWQITKQGNGWGAPEALVPYQDGLARYNPNFVPDASFLYYSESTCPGGNTSSGDCNADSDPSAVTWAVKPAAGSTPVKLANANKPGVADGATTALGDTFPRSAPFKTKHRGGQLFWFTVASRRKAGLKSTQGQQHLWMFAVDPAKVLAGQDGSYTGFYLPFQDLQTSNHIGQWTEKIVGGTEPPPAPPPPPPPAPPPPPPGVR